MKRVAFFFLLLSVAGCDYGARRQVSNLKEENESLQSQLDLSSVYIQDVTAIMDEVQKNLNAIEEREDIIGRISLETRDSEDRSRKHVQNVRRELLTSISDIDAFIQDNRTKMDALKDRVAKSAVRIESLERLVDNLTVTVEEKERSVNELKAQVQSLEQNVASLQGQVRQHQATIEVKDSTIAEQEATIRAKEEKIQQQAEEAATGYYVVGTKDELRKSGVIRERRSGFLGLKKTSYVGSIMTGHFTGVSKEQTTIPLDPSIRDIEIVSAHRDRPDLYRFDKTKTGSQLVIMNPERFWAISDYLVIISHD